MSIVTRQGNLIGDLQVEIMRLKAEISRLKNLQLEKPSCEGKNMREAAQSMFDDLYETADHEQRARSLAKQEQKND